MKYAVTTVLVTAGCLASTGPAAAFDSDDLAKFRETKRCIGCDLAGMLMENADLAGATIRDSDLVAATFDGANLTGANFQESDLGGVDFGDANLTRANLQGSDLSGAILRSTNLTGANLRGSRFKEAMTVDVIYCQTVMPSGQVRRPGCSGG